MGTKGAYGFRVSGGDLVTRSAFDSWPTFLGEEFAQFVRTTSQEEMAELTKAVKLLPEEESRRLARAQMFTDGTYVDAWRQLRDNIRGPQEDLHVLMPDANAFLLDSLYCEWAYIFDVDADCLEVYQGNQRQLGTGRYNRALFVSKNYKGEALQRNYTGVALVQVIPAQRLRAFSPEQIRELMAALEHSVCNEKAQAEDDLEDEGRERLVEARALIKKLMENPLTDLVISVRDNFR